MGTQICKKVQPDIQYQINAQKQVQKCTFPTCCNPTTEASQIQKNQVHKIKPIQFSQLQNSVDMPKAGSQKTIYNGSVTTYNNGTPRLVDKNIVFSQKQVISQQKYKNNDKITNQNKSIYDALSQNQLVIINKMNEQDSSIPAEYHHMSVPFSVIKLIIDPIIYAQLSKYGIYFNIQHDDVITESYRNWRLHEKGFYYNKIPSSHLMIIITKNQYYQGQADSNTYLPQGEGIIITLRGSYKGTVKNSKAHGYGIYQSVKGKNKCEGMWQNGQLKKGYIQYNRNQQVIRYRGCFLNSKPEGKGQLQITKIKNSVQAKYKYQGIFHNGKFHDQNGKYVCNDYLYKGSFSNGKKNGNGVLTPSEKALNSYPILKNYDKIVGVFKNDMFVETKEK